MGPPEQTLRPNVLPARSPSCCHRSAAVLFLLLVPCGTAWAAPPDAITDEPPAAGRPEDFSNVVGTYRLSDEAAPTKLAAEDRLLLTVRITGSGPPGHEPRRAGLHLFPAGIDRDFYIKPLPERDRRLGSGKEQTWEFAYELRPRRAGVAKVPALRLVYYDPANGYQTSYARAIPLTVGPRAAAQPPAEAAPAAAPDFLYDLATGPRLLRHEGDGWPGLPALLALLAAPPALCGLAYGVWRRRHPDANRLARRRRSQAAERALQSLRDGGADPGRVAGLLTAYLRQRLDLAAEEPTPREAARHLRRLGYPAALARRAAGLFRACDAARFASAAGPAAAGLADEAARLILALEAEPCSPVPA